MSGEVTRTFWVVKKNDGAQPSKVKVPANGDVDDLKKEIIKELPSLKLDKSQFTLHRVDDKAGSNPTAALDSTEILARAIPEDSSPALGGNIYILIDATGQANGK